MSTVHTVHVVDVSRPTPLNSPSLALVRVTLSRWTPIGSFRVPNLAFRNWTVDMRYCSCRIPAPMPPPLAPFLLLLLLLYCIPVPDSSSASPSSASLSDFTSVSDSAACLR